MSFEFFPPLARSDYNQTVAANGQMVSFSIKSGKRWALASTTPETGVQLSVTKVTKSGGDNLLPAPIAVANIIATPSVKKNDRVIYQTGTQTFLINGTNFRQKSMDLFFDPPINAPADYLLQVKSSTSMKLTLKYGHMWSNEPGPLKLRRIDTGAGPLRLDAKFGGVVIAEVQADLGQHGVTIESTPEQKLYQDSPEVTIVGTGFNETFNLLRWANGLRGKGVNYTTTAHTKEQLTLKLDRGDMGKDKLPSKWRANPSNLPGPLVVLAVNAGAGFVPVGPTEAKKGRTVATVYETPTVTASTQKIYRSHSHQLPLKGTGFVSGLNYETKLTFDPPLAKGEDYTISVHNRTCLSVLINGDKQWRRENGPIKVTSIDTGAGVRTMDVTVGIVTDDEAAHASGLTVQRSSNILYQSAAIRRLIIEGAGFTASAKLVFSPPLEMGTDYTITANEPTKLTLALKPGRKWRSTAGALMLVSMDCGKGAVPFAYGSGLQVANVIADPTVVESERLIYATHTRRLIIQGTGFSLDGTELTLRPTPRSNYEVESLETTEIVLLLNEGKKWGSPANQDSPVEVFVTKIDTGAGEVVMKGDGILVAKVEPDDDKQQCDDSCEWALDGVCDDGSGQGRYWWDDDYGGYNYGEEDDDYYGYGYYYYDDDDFLAPVCDVGTDCSDCGGPKKANELAPGKSECENSCQWARDGYCDDPRTSGLCDLGTDCQDCGPAGAANFTTWDDDGWWDDDDTYWDDDYDFGSHTASRTKISDHKSVILGDTGSGVVFMNMLTGIVVLVGAVVCGGGSLFAVKYLRGNQVPFYMPVASAMDDEELQSKPKTGVTPDVVRT
jgi:hypothetical protein